MERRCAGGGARQQRLPLAAVARWGRRAFGKYVISVYLVVLMLLSRYLCPCASVAAACGFAGARESSATLGP